MKNTPEIEDKEGNAKADPHHESLRDAEVETIVTDVENNKMPPSENDGKQSDLLTAVFMDVISTRKVLDDRIPEPSQGEFSDPAPAASNALNTLKVLDDQFPDFKPSNLPGSEGSGAADPDAFANPSRPFVLAHPHHATSQITAAMDLQFRYGALILQLQEMVRRTSADLQAQQMQLDQALAKYQELTADQKP